MALNPGIIHRGEQMRRLLICFIISAFFLFDIRAFASTMPPVVADGAMLIDAQTGRILYEKNKNVRFYPASTTKIMTALLVLEHCSLDEKVVIGKNPSSFIDGDKIYLYEGEEFTVDQLLHALLIASANDVAIALAEHVAGSVQLFAEMMNEKARELGCLDTHFTNPNGLDDPDHYTTPYDLSLVAREAMKYDIFRQIINTKYYIIAPTNKQPLPRPISTNIQIILNTKYHVEGANGIKVGYTDIAGHSFVGSAYRGDTKLMVVLMHDKKPGFWEDASSLLEYGFNTFKTEKEISSGDTIGNLSSVNPAINIPLITRNDFYYTYDMDAVHNMDTKVVITSDINKGITLNQKVGYVAFYDNGYPEGAVDLLSTSSLSPAPIKNPEKKPQVDNQPGLSTILISCIVFSAAAFVFLNTKSKKAGNR